MYSHRIEVLDRADNHDVVCKVAHHFELKLFPTEYRLFNQHLVNRRRGQSAANDFFKLFRVVSSAAAGSAKRERRANDRGITGLRHDRLCVVPRLRKTATRHLEAGFVHRLFEEQTILSDFNRVALCADHFDVVLAQHALLLERDCEIECGLTADSGQQRVRAFTTNYFRNGSECEWLDVSDVCGFRIGHDRCRVRIHQHDLIAFLAQCFAGLSSRIIKLARLADHNRTRANDQDFVYVSTFRHLDIDYRPTRR